MCFLTKAQFQETAGESRILLSQSPLLHSAFFTLTLINLGAINEIYYWPKLAREGERGKQNNNGNKEDEVTESRRALTLLKILKPNKPTSGKLWLNDLLPNLITCFQIYPAQFKCNWTTLKKIHWVPQSWSKFLLATSGVVNQTLLYFFILFCTKKSLPHAWQKPNIHTHIAKLHSPLPFSLSCSPTVPHRYTVNNSPIEPFWG